MAYTYTNSRGVTYYLHGNGRLFWFSPRKGKHALDSKPDGFTVKESQKTGLPFLKRR